MVIKLKIITLDPLEYNFHSNELLGKEMAYVLTLKLVIGVNIYGDIIDISKHAPIGGGGVQNFFNLHSKITKNMPQTTLTYLNIS